LAALLFSSLFRHDSFAPFLSLARDVKVYWGYYPVYLLYWNKSTNNHTPESLARDVKNREKKKLYFTCFTGPKNT
jgi:hypothetical protein